MGVFVRSSSRTRIRVVVDRTAEEDNLMKNRRLIGAAMIFVIALGIFTMTLIVSTEVDAADPCTQCLHATWECDDRLDLGRVCTGGCICQLTKECGLGCF